MALQNRQKDESMDKDILGSEFGTATKEQQIAWICQIIQKEVEKTDDEIDYDLIQECNDFLDELTADKIAYTLEEIEQRLRKQKENMQSSPEQVHPTQSRVSMLTRLKRLKTVFKAALVSIVIFAVLFVSVTIVAYAQGYSSAWNFISTNIQKIVGLNPGDRLEGDGITIIKKTGTVKCATIEELLQTENLDILYPWVLPQKIKLQKVIYSIETDSQYEISFQYNSEDISVSVRNYSSELSAITDASLYETEYTQFYIIELPDNYYQALGQYNGYEYCIIYKDYTALITILENMKDITK